MNACHHSAVARNIFLFSGLSEQEKDTLLEGGSVRSYGRKEFLFGQGKPIRHFYVICSGIVQETRITPGGNEITVGIHRDKDVLCKSEMFFQNGFHPTSAIAVTDVTVMELPLEQCKKNFLQCRMLSDRLLSSLAQFALMKQMEIEQQLTMTSVQIIACYLRQLCISHGLNPRGFTLPYKKSLIAARLGMELETFSRALPKLEEHGITVKGTHVSFHDKQAAHWVHYDGNLAQTQIKIRPVIISSPR